jgi:cyclophilin family peptidyl-prolyl cis-trans isomerase
LTPNPPFPYIAAFPDPNVGRSGDMEDRMFARQATRRARQLRPYRFLATWFAVAVIFASAGTTSEKDGAPSGLQAILEVHATHFSIGEPVEVRFSIWNPTDEAVRSLPSAPLTKHFKLYDADGEKVPPSSSAEVDAPRPGSLPPGGHYGIAFDLRDLYPRLQLGGTFRLVWGSGAIESNQLALKIVPVYDPQRQYRATLETTMGNVVLEFFRDKAPIAVKNFIDLAQSGFYDNTRFFFVDPGRMIAGGDRSGDGTGTPGYTIPMERNDLEMLAGTVAMKKMGTPPRNGSQFFILASPRPELKGRFTIFAQVVDGLDVVRLVSEVPNTGRRGSPANRPLNDVLIRKVVVGERPAPAS